MKELYQERLKLANRLWDEAKHRPVPGVEWIQAYATDMAHVLERVKKLEAENKRLRSLAKELSLDDKWQIRDRAENALDVKWAREDVRPQSE